MRVKNTLLLAILFVLFACQVQAAPEYYRKHIVLVVDQTPKTSRGGYLQPIGNGLLAFLNGQEVKASVKDLPVEFEYDSAKDLLEVFLYGLEGNVATQPLIGDAYNLLLASNGGVNNEKLFEQTIKGLVHPYKSAIEFSDLPNWWNVELKEVFSATSPLSKKIEQNSGYSFSAFLPNAVIPFINKTIPAQEYYIICVSTFQAGLSSNNAQYDIDILGDIYKNKKKASEFNNWICKIASPYQVSNWLNISEGSVSNKGVSAIGKQFVLKSAAKTSVNITSNINLEQKSYGGKTFKISPITVSFPKDENLEIKKITLEIFNGNDLYKQNIDNFTYNNARKEFTLTPKDIEFENKVDKNTNLIFNIVFTPVNDAKSDILPYVFTAGRDLPAKNIVFKSAPTVTYVIIVMILLALVSLAYLLYRFRTKYAKSDIKMNIWPISNSRFMDVSNNKVMNYDCWYFQHGDREKHIHVTGSVNAVYPKFAAKDKLVAEYMIEDIDMNEDFSFRPEGKTSNSEDRYAKEWYMLRPDENGDYVFDVISYLEKNLPNPDFGREDKNVLRLKVIVRTHFERNGKIVGPYSQVEKRYHFIVRPAIENSDIWVALDPGTTGSCIAYGWGGLPADTNNIHLACSRSTDTAGNENLSPIFYSKIKIEDHSALFKGVSPENLVIFNSDTGTGDFRFGNEAHIFWGRNSFQSIKKLLGYSNELEVRNSDGKVVKIKGEDLAHLLIKGLCREFEQYIRCNDDVQPYVKQHILTENHLTPSRAIVAVPNNYTVNKVQSMVDTIKRTHMFKEVHYLFEAEGVMMYFLNQNWSKLATLENKTFVVFDMGGATINATSFRLNVVTGENKGSIYIRKITVDTVSRVGYTVGGDNIDYALINILLNIPSVKRSLADTGLSKEDFMRKYKKRLISFAQHLKFDYIEASAGNPREDNWAKDEASFWTQLFKLLDGDCKITCPAEISAEDHAYLTSKDARSVMKSLVMDCVCDAINELVTDRFSSDVELIMSGRSILYPGIKNMVLNTLKKSGYNVNEWDYNGVKDRSEIVKTAVVRGACWYAMFSKYVELRHDTVTSTFGFMDQVDGKVKFNSVIAKNLPFDENGEIESTIEPTDPTIDTIKFVQMLGSNYDEIYSKPALMHKMAELTQVPQTVIRGEIRSIKIKIDSNNNFSYEIKVAGEPLPICGTCVASDADITDTNSEAYAFAALSSLEDETTSENETNIGKIRVKSFGGAKGGRRF